MLVRQIGQLNWIRSHCLMQWKWKIWLQIGNFWHCPPGSKSSKHMTQSFPLGVSNLSISKIEIAGSLASARSSFWSAGSNSFISEEAGSRWLERRYSWTNSSMFKERWPKFWAWTDSSMSKERWLKSWCTSPVLHSTLPPSLSFQTKNKQYMQNPHRSTAKQTKMVFSIIDSKGVKGRGGASFS